MRGHEAIVAMRQRGKKPAIVYLDTQRDHSPMKAWQDWPEVQPAIPTVWVQPEDTPGRLDLRFLVGLTVVVTGTDADRVRQLEQACLDAAAFRVIAAVVESVASAHPRTPTYRSQRVTDSLLPENNTDPETADHGADHP